MFEATAINVMLPWIIEAFCDSLADVLQKCMLSVCIGIHNDEK